MTVKDNINNNLIIVKDYSIESYKGNLKEFYDKVKLLFKEIENINNSVHIINNIEIKNINNELDLKNNKHAMDLIINTFKPLIDINNDIKKTLNNWKSNFAVKMDLII